MPPDGKGNSTTTGSEGNQEALSEQSIPIISSNSQNRISEPGFRTTSTTTPDDKDAINNNGLRSTLNKSNDKNLKGLDPRLLDVYSDYYPPLVFVWRNMALVIYLHAAAVVGLYLLLSGNVQWRTILWTLFYHCLGTIGFTAGAHRLWSHRSFKANFPLRVLLTFMQTISFQDSVYMWCREHRLHHKYSETHADPNNPKRGFWFAQMGWTVCKKHPMVKEKGKTIDLSDLEADPVLMFQRRHFLPLALTCSWFLPAIVPWYFWGESFITAWFVAAQLRYCVSLHSTGLINSVAHLWGPRPYDKTIGAVESLTCSIFALGEGYHNYHHTFPWDYKAAELGVYKHNFTTAFIDFFAWIGWAYDLKTVSEKLVKERVIRTGDGTHGSIYGHHHQHQNSSGTGEAIGSWGWGDENIPKEDKEVTEIRYPR